YARGRGCQQRPARAERSPRRTNDRPEGQSTTQRRQPLPQLIPTVLETIRRGGNSRKAYQTPAYILAPRRGSYAFQKMRRPAKKRPFPRTTWHRKLTSY